MITLLHCADLHLEASFATEGQSPAAGRVRRAGLRQALERILTLAAERRVDAVTIAGDLYEQDYAGPGTATYLQQQFAAAAPIPIFIAPGEHDPLTEDSLYALTRWPENVRIFPPGPLSRLDVGPELHLWGAAHPLAPGLDLRPEPLPEEGGLNLLLLHTLHPLEETTVREAGFALALLGGEHAGRVGPTLVYPGSVEPLTVAEMEDEHLAVLVTVEDGACRVETIPISRARRLELTVDLSGCSSQEEAAALIGINLRSQGGQEGVDESTLAQVTLIGAQRFDLDAEALIAAVDTPATLQCEVRLKPDYDLTQYADEPTARGILVRRLQERLAQGAGDDIARQALILALRALDGRRVRPV